MCPGRGEGGSGFLPQSRRLGLRTTTKIQKGPGRKGIRLFSPAAEGQASNCPVAVPGQVRGRPPQGWRGGVSGEISQLYTPTYLHFK